MNGEVKEYLMKSFQNVINVDHLMIFTLIVIIQLVTYYLFNVQNVLKNTITAAPKNAMK